MRRAQIPDGTPGRCCGPCGTVRSVAIANRDETPHYCYLGNTILTHPTTIDSASRHIADSQSGFTAISPGAFER